MHKILLTFDVEDFINANEIQAIYLILHILNKYGLKAIFFITGHMAEKISNYPSIIEMLKLHEIGYHSSSHSVRPTIPEYTDVKSYEKAYEISIERETSHINPLTGKVEEEGGIIFLRNLFYPKRIEAFRAPGMYWTPPHLEALRDLGIKYDFSSSITMSKPVHYKRITFYPYSFIQEWNGKLYDYQCLLYALLKREIAVLDLHPTLFVNQEMWDRIYLKGNPLRLINARSRPFKESASLFTKFEILLKQIRLLQRAKLIKTGINLNSSPNKLITNKDEVKRCYETCMQWCKKAFKYKPKFILSHFYEFFEDACQ
jgi:peptidoglycan/xylan/chitin deacetylase (PgdA/CDA1 family)